MSTDEYVPSEDDVRMAYLEAHVDMADPITRHQRAQAEREAEDAWTAFLARVRREAVEEYKNRQVQIHLNPTPPQPQMVPARMSCPRCGFR